MLCLNVNWNIITIKWFCFFSSFLQTQSKFLLNEFNIEFVWIKWFLWFLFFFFGFLGEKCKHLHEIYVDCKYTTHTLHQSHCRQQQNKNYFRYSKQTIWTSALIFNEFLPISMKSNQMNSSLSKILQIWWRCCVYVFFFWYCCCFLRPFFCRF